MNERRPLFAMILIVAIAYIPIAWLRSKNPPPPPIENVMDSTSQQPAVVASDKPAPLTAGTAIDSAAPLATVAAPATPEDTVVVQSGLYRYGISTLGGRIVSAEFLKYKSLELKTKGDTLEVMPTGGSLFASRVLLGNDTLHLDRIAFTASTDSLDTSTAPGTVTLTGNAGARVVTLTWRFNPDSYRFDVSGTISSLGAVGGTMLLDLGDGFRDTEANIVENHRESGIVTKLDKTQLKRFSAFKPRIEEILTGPFEWVAVKSKYFVVALFATDSTAVQGAPGLVSSARVFPTDSLSKPVRAEVGVSLTVPATGAFGYHIYLGPMEYDRLKAMGNDFDDVNPYGFAWLRGIIRPFAVAIRAVFLGMHGFLGVGFGLVIVIFGVMVRILLWPLNQKAMRSMTGMQAIQPELQAIQEKYKGDPTKLQQEMFKLYKEHGVSPLGGCWPMLLPYPLLVAVFFVLQNTIELRGVSFMWMPDLAQKDPTFVIPVLMAASMFGISWISQRGLPPNPQAKMMMYLMPGIFMVMFQGFASGLNLYYLVQNLAQIPQQLMISKERQKLLGARVAATSGKKVEVRSK